MLFFSTLKAKIYAAISIITIAFLAYVKWLRASNEQRKRKIDVLKKEVKQIEQKSKADLLLGEYYATQDVEDMRVKNAINEFERYKKEVWHEKKTSSSNSDGYINTRI